nr:DUF1553 domain-containing protein [Verrucomicrobium spinosum]
MASWAPVRTSGCRAAAHPSGTSRLAGSLVHGQWLGYQALCKLIAMSATYRQSSLPERLEMLKEDPDNKLLARGPRQRLTAEQLRDNALAVSGLLNRRLLGPPVMPYQLRACGKTPALSTATPRARGRTSSVAAFTPSGVGPCRHRP